MLEQREMRTHLYKKAIRALGIAESFSSTDAFSTLAGVVMRTDMIVDGTVFGRAMVEGDDATDQIARMFLRLRRKDVNLIILQGCIISLYNVVDVDELSEKTQTPVICLTFKTSRGIGAAIRRHFPGSSAGRVRAYKKLGGRSALTLRTRYRVYVRTSDISLANAEKVLNAFTLQGSVPEPVRLAKLMARARRQSV